MSSKVLCFWPRSLCLLPASCGRLTCQLVSRVQLQTQPAEFLTSFVCWLSRLILTKSLGNPCLPLFWLSHYPSSLRLDPTVNSLVITSTSYACLATCIVESSPFVRGHCDSQHTASAEPSVTSLCFSLAASPRIRLRGQTSLFPSISLTSGFYFIESLEIPRKGLHQLPYTQILNGVFMNMTPITSFLKNPNCSSQMCPPPAHAFDTLCPSTGSPIMLVFPSATNIL